VSWIKKFRACISVLVVAVLVVVFWPSVNKSTQGQVADTQGQGRIADIRIAAAQHPVGGIFGENDINQIFVSNVDNLAEIQILFATWGRNNSGSLFVKISEVEGEEFFSQTLDMAGMVNNSFVTFKFPPRTDSKNKRYSINLSSPESTPDNNVTCWGMKDNVPKGFELTYGSNKSNLVMVFNTFTG
jgi:hypothetical protein